MPVTFVFSNSAQHCLTNEDCRTRRWQTKAGGVQAWCANLSRIRCPQDPVTVMMLGSFVVILCNIQHVCPTSSQGHSALCQLLQARAAALKQ